ncbi:HIT domain-containing protein [Streptomyces erythrochromogenes]|nr:HIT domain-containing protein [Streptomyces erythrochromogenes]
MDCTFCGLIREGITGWVARGPVACAFTPLNPLAPGHTLVVPTLHYADIFETPPEVLSVVTALVQRVAAATRTALNASGVNIFSAHACTAREASDRLRPGPWHRTGTDVEGPNPCRGRAGGLRGRHPSRWASGSAERQGQAGAMSASSARISPIRGWSGWRWRSQAVSARRASSSTSLWRPRPCRATAVASSCAPA